MENSPILIIGTNGKTGRRANKRLPALLYPTRAVSRSTSPSFDWEQPETWQPAMEGSQRVSAYLGVCAPVEVDWFRYAPMSARLTSCCIYAVMVATFTGIIMSNAVQAQEQTFA